MEIIAVYYNINTGPLNTIFCKNADLNVKVRSTYSYEWALNGQTRRSN